MEGTIQTVSPNENYARELMELFTLGKGELAGPGDYTTFTEQDVKEIARGTHRDGLTQKYFTLFHQNLEPEGMIQARRRYHIDLATSPLQMVALMSIKRHKHHL